MRKCKLSPIVRIQRDDFPPLICLSSVSPKIREKRVRFP
jgi:hypothetical protein